MEHYLQRSIYFQQMEKAAKDNDNGIVARNYRVLVPLLAIVFQILLIITASIFLEDAVQEVKGKGSNLTFVATSSVAIVVAVFQLATSVFSIKDFDSMKHIWCPIHIVCAVSLAIVTSVSYTYHAQDLGTGQLYLITSLMNAFSTMTLVFLLYVDVL